MGSSLCVNLGPYLECKNRIERVFVECQGCSKCKTEVWNEKIKFCEVCGTAVGKYKKIEFQPVVDVNDLIDTLDEVLMNFDILKPIKNIDFWISNQRNTACFSKDLADDYDNKSGVYELTDTVISEELEAFETYFKKQIDIIRKAYGQANVKLKWGVIRYMM